MNWHDFTVSVLKLAVWLAVLAAIFVPLEKLFSLHPRKPWRAGMAGDIAFFFLSSLLPAFVLALPTAWLALAVRRWAPPGWGDWSTGLPAWLRFVLVLAVGDLGAYWGHRLSHRISLLWRFHAIHHSATQMDWLVHTRAHPVDMVFVRLCGMLPVFAFGLARPSGAGVLFVAITTIVSTVWGFMVHANLRWRFGALEQIVASPVFHHWHHARVAPLDRNFSAMLPWIDRLFGTLYLPRHWPDAYGTHTPTPTSFSGQLLDPLLPARTALSDAVLSEGAEHP